MSFVIQLADENEMLRLGAQLAKVIPNGTVIYLTGSLGAGKTTLVRGLLRGLGYEDPVKSPTYTLVEPYEVAGKKIYHFDVYRIDDAEELEYIGIRDYFDKDSICLIEWPENAQGVLPSADLWCKISIPEKGRIVTLEGYSDKGCGIIQHAGFFKN